MKKTLLALFLLAGGHNLLAQLPTNSFAVTAACPANVNNPTPSVLQKVNTDGSLTPIATVTEASSGTPLIINALGYDSNPANQEVLYGMNVVLPVTVSNFNTPPNLYQIGLANAVATNLGQVTPPPTPTSGLSSPLPSEIFQDFRQTFNFIGDGGPNSTYFVAGATFRLYADLVTGARRVSDLRLYVGVIPLTPFVSAAPTRRRLDTSDANTTAVVLAFQTKVQAFITSNGTNSVPEGGLQDWVYDVGTGNLVSYLGQDYSTPLF